MLPLKFAQFMRPKKMFLITSRLTQSLRQIAPDPKYPIWTRQFEPNHLSISQPSSTVSQSFTIIGVFQKYNFVCCCVSHRNGHTLRMLRRTFEVGGQMRREDRTDYMHAGRDEVRLQPLVRTEVNLSHITSFRKFVKNRHFSGNFLCRWDNGRALMLRQRACVNAEATAVR